MYVYMLYTRLHLAHHRFYPYLVYSVCIIYMVSPCTKHACVVYNCCELRLAENLNIKYVHMYIHIALSLLYRAIIIQFM